MVMSIDYQPVVQTPTLAQRALDAAGGVDRFYPPASESSARAFIRLLIPTVSPATSVPALRLRWLLPWR